MKRISYILSLFLLPIFISCEDGATESDNNDSADEMIEEATDELDNMMEAEEEDEMEEMNEVEIHPDSLPHVIKHAIEEKYPDYAISEVDKVTGDDGRISYDIELKTEGDEIEVMYSSSGNFLGEEIDATEEGNEDADEEEGTDM